MLRQSSLLSLAILSTVILAACAQVRPDPPSLGTIAEAAILQQLLQTNEPDIFAGLYLNRQPDEGIVLLLTVPPSQGQSILAPYLRDLAFDPDAIDFEQVRFSLAQLTAVHADFNTALAAHGIDAASNLRVFDNGVEFFALDLRRTDELIAGGDLQLPDGVVIIRDEGFEDLEALARRQGDFPLPTRPAVSRPVAELEADLHGTLEADLVAGCVWLVYKGGPRPPVVWPAGTTATLDPFTINLPDGQEAQPGDLLEGGSGTLSSSDSEIPVPPHCIEDGEITVFNHYLPITVSPR